MKRHITTYTLSQFISNIRKRKSMYRYDKVNVDFSDLYNMDMDERRITYTYCDDGDEYKVYLDKNGKNSYNVGVNIGRYMFDIGTAYWDNIVSDENTDITIDCDCRFYN